MKQKLKAVKLSIGTYIFSKLGTLSRDRGKSNFFENK